MHEIKKPEVGIAVIVRNYKRVFLGKRLSNLGDGAWGFPGGKLDFGENPYICAMRELEEETGMRLKPVDKYPAAVTSDFFRKEGRHFITLYFRADYKGGNPIIMEPDKCERWEWFSWDNLPEPLFLPLANLIKQKYNPFD